MIAPSVALRWLQQELRRLSSRLAGPAAADPARGRPRCLMPLRGAIVIIFCKLEIPEHRGIIVQAEVPENWGSVCMRFSPNSTFGRAASRERAPPSELSSFFLPHPFRPPPPLPPCPP